MSQETMQRELLLALECRTLMFQALSKHPEAHELIQKELIDILYAKNIEQLNISQQNMTFILHKFIHSNAQKHQVLNDALNHLLEQRKAYLQPPPRTFLNTWSEESWTGMNFLILTIPFVVSLFVPVIAPLALGYASLDAILASIDMGRAHRNYWSEENPPETRILNEDQIQSLKDSHQDIEAFLPENNPDPNALMTLRINRASYGTYALVFAISIIGLAALLFPPVGIPLIALICLSVVGSAATGVQLGLIYQKKQMQSKEIQEALTESETLLSTNFIEHHNINAILSSHTPIHSKHLSAHATPPIETRPTLSSLDPASIKPNSTPSKKPIGPTEKNDDDKQSPHL